MNARFTSKADIDATQTDVCFVPIADICRVIPCRFQIVADQFAGPVAQAKKPLCSFAFRYYFSRRATIECR
jgi:hypothetical protein